MSLETTPHLFVWIEGEDVRLVGSYDPPGRRASSAVGVACITRSRATAERWRKALHAGHLPEHATAPVDREWGDERSSHSVTGDGDDA